MWSLWMWIATFRIHTAGLLRTRILNIRVCIIIHYHLKKTNSMWSKRCEPHPRWPHRAANDYISLLKVLFTMMTYQTVLRFTTLMAGKSRLPQPQSRRLSTLNRSLERKKVARYGGEVKNVFSETVSERQRWSTVHSWLSKLSAKVKKIDIFTPVKDRVTKLKLYLIIQVSLGSTKQA